MPPFCTNGYSIILYFDIYEVNGKKIVFLLHTPLNNEFNQESKKCTAFCKKTDKKCTSKQNLIYLYHLNLESSYK